MQTSLVTSLLTRLVLPTRKCCTLGLDLDGGDIAHAYFTIETADLLFFPLCT